METDTEGEIEKARDRKKTDKDSPEHSKSIVTDGTLETDTEGEIEKARDRKKTDKGSPEHSESIVTDGTLETDTEGEEGMKEEVTLENCSKDRQDEDMEVSFKFAST